MNSKYHHVFLGQRIGPSNVVRSSGKRSSGKGLKAPCDLEKWKTSVLLCSMTKLNFLRREVIMW